MCSFLRIVSLSFWLNLTLEGIECYVVAKCALLLFLIFMVPQEWVWVAFSFASYLMMEMFLYRFRTLLFGTFDPPIVGEPYSVYRSILLFIFNASEVILTFAICYRWFDVSDPIKRSLLVFGTAGYPEQAIGPAAFQIGVDFLLVAIFLSTIIARLNRDPIPSNPPQRPFKPRPPQRPLNRSGLSNRVRRRRSGL